MNDILLNLTGGAIVLLSDRYYEWIRREVLFAIIYCRLLKYGYDEFYQNFHNNLEIKDIMIENRLHEQFRNKAIRNYE